MDEKTLQKVRTFESAMQLKDLVVGTTITETHVEAVEYLLGGILKPLRSIPMTEYVIDFTGKEPRVTKDGFPSIGEITIKNVE